MKTFEHVKLDSLKFDLESKTTESGRVYVTPDGRKYPSVTTVLGSMGKQAIMEWRKRVGFEEANRISRLASSRGTKLHSVCEKYLLNEMTQMKLNSMMPDTKALFRTLKPVLDENVGKIYSLEQALYSHVLMVAGRVDCIAEWNGELSVIDFKTSTKLKEENYIQNYFMQCTIYSQMFEEITNIPINQIVVAIATEESDTPQIFVRDKRDYWDKTRDFINNYHLTAGTNPV